MNLPEIKQRMQMGDTPERIEVVELVDRIYYLEETIEKGEKMERLKYLGLNVLGVLCFPIMVIALAMQGGAMDMAGDEEGAEDYTYQVWNGYLDMFWRKK